MISKDSIKKAVLEAIKLGSGRRFKQSVELIVVFKGYDPKSPDIKFRDAVYLPKGLGKPPKILVIADGELLTKARELGVDVLSREEVQKLSKRGSKKIARKYDWFLVKSDLMTVVGKVLGPSLGPRGKFPIPIQPSANLDAIIKQYSMSTRLRNKEQPWVGCRVGTEDMDPDDITENIMTVLEFIESKIKKPIESVCRVYIKTTMGEPVEVMMK
ncbi:MAG: 50S ribosomal protein L1 [Desulfurococcaceae archaeon]|nr:50S ribosomal protein L1 [Desulfurococcaceae archaeon]